MPERRLLALIICFTIGCGCGPSKSANNSANDLPTMTDDYFDRGHRSYLDNCARCHGLSSADVHAWLSARPFSEYLLRSVVRNGRESMPSFPKTILDDFTLHEMVEYLRIIRRSVDPDGVDSLQN